jgi:hypothetical protein
MIDSTYPWYIFRQLFQSFLFWLYTVTAVGRLSTTYTILLTLCQLSTEWHCLPMITLVTDKVRKNLVAMKKISNWYLLGLWGWGTNWAERFFVGSVWEVILRFVFRDRCRDYWYLRFVESFRFSRLRPRGMKGRNTTTSVRLWNWTVFLWLCTAPKS